MAEVFFDNPPAQGGTAEEQLKTLHGYLQTLSQKLNEALMNISLEQLAENGQTAIINAQKGAEAAEENRQGLKELIIKNAEISRTEEEEIRAQLSRNVEAISEAFGTYQESTTAEFQVTAQGIQQIYNSLQTVTSNVEGISDYQTALRGYIYSGELQTSPRKVGIAIGQNVTNEDGTLNDANKVATFTSDRITFYLNGVEMGYYEGTGFHIPRGEVEDSMKMGNFVWKIFEGGAMGLMKE